jgi:transposase
MKDVLPNLNDEDKALMQNLLKAGQIKLKYAIRIQTVLHRAAGKPAKLIAEYLGIDPATVSMHVKRYNTGGVESLLHDKTRKPGRAPISEEVKNEICNVACHEKPEGAAHWSTRMLAKRFKLGKGTISNILRERDVKPHIVSYYQFSTDPLFKEKLTDVVGLYLNPPDNAIVLCVDEKTEIQALERSQPMLPLAPHSPKKMTNDYYRHGTTTLFAALNMLTGNVEGATNQSHKSSDFIAFLKGLDAANEKGKVLHIVCDNYAAHKSKETNAYLDEHKERFVMHYTPTHSSWANMVERWFGELSRKRLSNESWNSVEELVKAIKEFIATWNESGQKFSWHKTAATIIASAERAKAHVAAA